MSWIPVCSDREMSCVGYALAQIIRSKIICKTCWNLLTVVHYPHLETIAGLSLANMF